MFTYEFAVKTNNEKAQQSIYIDADDYIDAILIAHKIRKDADLIKSNADKIFERKIRKAIKRFGKEDVMLFKIPDSNDISILYRIDDDSFSFFELPEDEYLFTESFLSKGLVVEFFIEELAQKYSIGYSI